MATLDRIILIENVEWLLNSRGTAQEPDTDSVLQSWTVWAQRRDLGQSLEFSAADSGAYQVRLVEYLVRFFPELGNYTRSLSSDADQALRMTDGGLRLLVTHVEEVGRNDFMYLQARTPLAQEAGSDLPWRLYGAGV